MNRMNEEALEGPEGSESQVSGNPPQELPRVFYFGSDDEAPV